MAASLEQLESALVKADAAGDADSARVLAGEVRKMRQTAAPKGQPKDAGPELEKPGVMVGVGRGMMDLYQGIKQLGLRAKDQFTGGKEADEYTKSVSDEIKLYEQGRGKDAGFDWARLAGNIATPAIAVPGGVGATVARQAATGAGLGAAQAGAMFTEEGADKGAQTGAGALVGAALPYGLSKIAGALRGAANKGGNAVANVVRGGVDDSQVLGAVQSTLQKEGIDFAKLTSDAQGALAAEAKAQLDAGGTLNSQALARIANAQQVDPRLQLTRGQATRAPQDWQTEQNLRSVQGVGDDLRARFGQQGQILGEAAERLKPVAATDRPFQAGEQAIGAIQQKFKESGDEVSSLYKAARDTVGLQADVPLAPLQGRAIQVLNEFEDVIPGPIKSRLQEFGVDRMGAVSPTKAFTVEQAESLDKLINKRWDPANKPLTAALTELKGAIRDSLDQIGSEGGSETVKAFQKAKQSAAARFDEFGQKVARAAAEDVAPDKFVKKFVTGAEVRDIRGLVKTLTSGTPEQIQRGQGALESLRAATLSEIFEGKGAVVDGMLSGTKLDKALKDIGSERLNALFTPSQVRDLERLRGVSIDLTRPPPLSDINYSRTTSALANLLNSVGKVPGLGIAAKLGQTEVERGQRKAAETALRGSAATKAAPREFVNAGAQNAMVRRGLLAAPAVNAMVYQQNQ